MPKYKDFHIILRKEGDTFVAKAIENNISSFGTTQEEALKNTKEALDLYYEDEKEAIYDKISSVSLVSYSMQYA